MTLSHEHEQIVELLKGIAAAGEQIPGDEQPTGLFLPGAAQSSLPWQMIERQTNLKDFGVGMPPLTQRYS